MNGARSRLDPRLVAIFTGGLALAVWPLFGSSAAQAWGAIAASWLFVTGAALGCVALSAASRIAAARFADRLLPFCERAEAFLPWSFGVLALLILAGPHWLPWMSQPVALSRRWWLNPTTFAIRELGATALLFWLARRCVRAPRSSLRPAIIFVLAFAAILTVWAVDFILALDREWVSALIGAYYFMGSFLAGVALASLRASASTESDDLRHDTGKLLFGFSVFWAYLFWAQFLTIWYGNLPAEIGFVVRREHEPWLPFALAAIVLVFILPFGALMREVAKRRPWILSSCAVGILAGLWLNLYVLIAPSLGPLPSVGSISAGLGSLICLGALLGRAFSSKERPADSSNPSHAPGILPA